MRGRGHRDVGIRDVVIRDKEERKVRVFIPDFLKRHFYSQESSPIL